MSAELRNRIYEFAVQDLRDDQAKRVTSDEFYVLRRCDTPMHPALDYRGFTQTCRQLRTEFRPLYVGAKTAYISACEAPDYVEAYFPGAEPIISLTRQSVFMIVLEPVPGTQRGASTYYPVPLRENLYPILTALYNKKTELGFATKDERQVQVVDDLNNWFRNHKEAWSAAVEKDLSCLYVHKLEFFRPQLQLIFKKQHTQSWVPEATSNYNSEGLKAYMSSLG
jgi:hypothetical protein